MEKIVRILSQFPMQSREWTPENGEKKLIKSVEVVMSDGNDTFTAEAADNMAEVLNEHPLDKEMIHSVQVRMSVRSWKTKDDKEVRNNTIRIINIKPL